jgi:hypothetical protein
MYLILSYIDISIPNPILQNCGEMKYTSHTCDQFYEYIYGDK